MQQFKGRREEREGQNGSCLRGRGRAVNNDDEFIRRRDSPKMMILKCFFPFSKVGIGWLVNIVLFGESLPHPLSRNLLGHIPSWVFAVLRRFCCQPKPMIPSPKHTCRTTVRPPPPYSLVLNGFCFLLEEGGLEGGKNVFLRPTRARLRAPGRTRGRKKLVLLFFAPSPHSVSPKGRC